MQPGMITESDVLEAVKKYRVIVACRKVPENRFSDTVRALYEGGIRLLEVTFDQSSPTAVPDTQKCIGLARDLELPGLLVGAGTVLTAEQVEAARRAGAQYILAPNTSARVIESSRASHLAVFPGAFTPSEITEAYSLGATCIKVFPANSLGPAYIKAIRSPISHIPMIAMGGVNAENMQSYLDAGVIGVGVGSNLVNLKKINENDFKAITKLAKEYTIQF